MKLFTMVAYISTNRKTPGDTSPKVTVPSGGALQNCFSRLSWEAEAYGKQSLQRKLLSIQFSTKWMRSRFSLA